MPSARVIEGSDHNLYGTTTSGGLYGVGTVYRVLGANQSQTITVTQSAPPSAVFNTSFNVAATGGASGNPVVIAGSGACSGGGNSSVTITMTSGTGTCTVTFNQAGGGGYDPALQVTQQTTAQKATAVITWSNPADIFWGVTLGGTQLTATANAAGTFVYNPPATTLLPVGNGQTLSTSFTPTATNNYNSTGANVSINVLPPDTTLTSFPATPTNQTSASFSFTSTKSGGLFECSFDGTAFTACTSPKSYTGLAEGSHTFLVRATDGLGHVDPSPASRVWVIDITKPNTTITSGPQGPTNSTTAQFTFTATEAATFQCSLDASAFTACSSGVTYNSLTVASHTFQVRAVDLAGNIDPSPASRNWSIDLTAPDTSITSAPTSPTTSKKAQFKFSSTESGGTFQCSLDNAAFTPCSSPQNYNGLATVSHTFKVKAIDAAGNVDASPASFTWTIQ